MSRARTYRRKLRKLNPGVYVLQAGAKRGAKVLPAFVLRGMPERAATKAALEFGIAAHVRSHSLVKGGAR